MTPHAHEIYQKPGRLQTRVQVITIDRQTANGWLCLAQPVYRDGTCGDPLIVSITANDTRIGRAKLTKTAAARLKAWRRTQRLNRAAYVADDGCTRMIDGAAVEFPQWGI